MAEVDANSGCGCMTNRTGCLIFAWIDVVLLTPLILIVLVVLYLALTGLPLEWLASTLGQFVIYVVLLVLAVLALYLYAACCLIHGVTTEKQKFVMVFIICAILKDIVSFGSFWAVATSNEPTTKSVLTAAAWFVYEIYKTTVAIYHYIYLSRKPPIIGTAMTVLPNSNKGLVQLSFADRP